MNSIEAFDMNPSLIALGRLETLQSFKVRPKQAIGLPGDIPVLTCPVAVTDAHCFDMKNAHVNVGFGVIRLTCGLVQTVRVQVDNVQVYWLADMTDPEVWSALDKWRQAKQALVQFDVRGQPGKPGRSVFLKPEVPQGTYRNEEFRNASIPPAKRIWHGMATLADSGILQRGAETDIEGIPLRRVFVNLLFTQRFRPCVDVDKLVEMSTQVKPVVRQGIVY